MITHINALFTCLLWTSLCIAWSATAFATQRPNVIVMLVDDLGSQDVGCYGGPVNTPALDDLAARGVRFTDFHSGAAVCSPLRATLMTGRQHMRAGIYHVLQDQMHNAHLLEREVTVAELLRQAGYGTAHFGKWHMGISSGARKKPSPSEHGFDYWFGLANGAHPSHKDPVNFIRNGKPVGPMKGYSCQLLADDAIRWLEEKRVPDHPFFLNIWFNEPHAVIAAPDDIVSRYGDLKDEAAIYSATIDNTDRAIARVVAKLKDIGALENTLIIFSSDHGSYRDDRNGGLRGNKGSNFEGGLRSPGIFFWPRGFAGGRALAEPSGSVDLLPTICGLVGIEKPTGVHLDGADLSPLLTGQGRFERTQPLFWHLPTSGPAVALRDGRYTLMGYRNYELPQNHTAMNALLERIAKLVGADGKSGGGNLRSRVFNTTFSSPEANRLRREYVQLNTFQESWIPLIKAGGFRRFELYDVIDDPKQTKDISTQQPGITARLKKKLLAIHKSVMADSPDWLTEEEIEAQEKAQKALAESLANPSRMKPNDLLAALDARPLPDGYEGSRHQDFVDKQIARLTPQQRGRVSQLWKEKQRIDPDMPNRGFSFVKILMFVADGEKLDGQKIEQKKDWFRKQKTTNKPIVRPTGKTGVELNAGHPTLLSPHSDPIALHQGTLFVVNTPADTLDVIDTTKNRVVSRIPVGVDPVSVQVRPDGKEVWVSNHISDSISVIDNDPNNPTYFSIIATIQDIDLRKKSTRFNEPVGIAFANNEKAYVALSSSNQIAVVDVDSRRVVDHLKITAQEPRAIRVRDGKLYVIPFESNNQTQLSGGREEDMDGKLVTFDAQKLADSFDTVGFTVDVIKHSDIPDRDLYVFDTETDKLITTVVSLGTLQFGLDVDSNGNVLIAHTDARNHVNGRAGTKKHGLKELENRPYLNRIARVSAKGEAEFIRLNSLPPEQPDRESAIATPFAVRADGKVIYLTAAGSDHLITLNAATSELLGRVKVGAVPRGIALQHDVNTNSYYAWVFNAIANSVSKVDVGSPKQPTVIDTIALNDPTPNHYKAGRIAFNTSRASSNGTYSCASCHPDGHTDQLLWVLATPHLVGADQIEPRLSQTLRGLRGTAPYHWDGVPGDPYGGRNASTRELLEPNSDINKPESAVRHLIDGAMATTMLQSGSDVENDESKKGYLNAAERDVMAAFLLNLSHMPTPGRAYVDELSDDALTGFERFHITGARDRKNLNTSVCGSCHTFPYLTTDTSEMNVPSFRGALDRFVTQAQGRNSVISLGGVKEIAEEGFPEEEVWRRMLNMGEHGRLWPVIDMFRESSSGFSGAFGRQVTLSQNTVKDPVTSDLLRALERAAADGSIVLEANGLVARDSQQKPYRVTLVYDSKIGEYVRKADPTQAFSNAELLELAANGEFIGTFTGHHGSDVTSPPAAIWTAGSLHQQRGAQLFPRINEVKRVMKISGRHVQQGASLYVNGRRVRGSIESVGPDLIEVAIDELPDRGMNMLQVQNPDSYMSNEFIFFVETEAQAISRYKNEPPYLLTTILNSAIINDDPEEARIVLEAGADLNMPHEHFDKERPPLILAAQYGRTWLIDELLKRGADPNIRDKHGVAALHEAAKLCRFEICKKLIAAGATKNVRDKQDNRPLDLTSRFIQKGNFEKYYAPYKVNMTLDHERYRQERLKVRGLLIERNARPM